VVQESKDPTYRRIDTIGILTLTLTLVSLIWFLLHGREVAGIKLPVAATVVIPLICFVAFLASQRWQETPLLELSLFSNPAFLGMCLVPLALSLSYWSLLVYLPLFLQTGIGRALNSVSILMLAATLPMFLLPFVGARLVLLLTPRWFFSTGLAVVGASCLLLAHSAQSASLPSALLGMLLCGSAAAVLNSQISSAIMSYAPKERSGAVSAIATILRQGGFAAGIALLGALLNRAATAEEATSASPHFTPLFVTAGLAGLLAAAGILLLLRPPANLAR
jgi:MFS family permease